MPTPNMRIWMTDNGPVHVYLGEVTTLNAEAERRGIAPAGSQVELYCWHYDYQSLVGLRAISPEYQDNWNDLEDNVEHGRGYWMELADLVVCTDYVKPRNMVVSQSHKFKDVELKGMECKILSYIQNTKLVFVEFDKEIGGCSADGLGRRGCCIAVPKNILKQAEDKKKSRAKAKEK